MLRIPSQGVAGVYCARQLEAGFLFSTRRPTKQLFERIKSPIPEGLTAGAGRLFAGHTWFVCTGTICWFLLCHLPCTSDNSVTGEGTRNVPRSPAGLLAIQAVSLGSSRPERPGPGSLVGKETSWHSRMSLQHPHRGDELPRITPLTACLACQAPSGSSEQLNPNHVHQTPSLEEKR